MKRFNLLLVLLPLFINCATQQQVIPFSKSSASEIKEPLIEKEKNCEHINLLSENERYKVWIQICKIDERARNDAYLKYPLFNDPSSSTDYRLKCHALYWEYMQKYKSELAKELDIELDNLESILSEGLKKEWPLE